MKNRGELGCGIIAIVAVIAAGVYLLLNAPWFLLAIPAGLVAIIVALLALADITTDDVIVTTEEQGGFTSTRLKWLNKARKALGKTQMLQVPKLGVTFEERQLIKQATKIATEVAATLKSSNALTADHAQLKQQIDDVPANMARALWRLDRTRRMARALNINTQEGKRSREELSEIERQILKQMENALTVLGGLPVNLMRVEMARTDAPNERLLTSLDETNRQLLDLTAAYDEVRGRQTNQ